MAWTVHGIPYYNASELTDTTVKQGMTFPYASILKAVRTWVILYGNPTFTNLSMDIYSTSLVLLHSSTNNQAKASLASQDYSVTETYFEFANVNLAKDTEYFFVLKATGYGSVSTSSHIAWRTSYPDPVIPLESALTKVEANKYPLAIYPIFARFDEP